jgi:signal transduction histidine kinase
MTVIGKSEPKSDELRQQQLSDRYHGLMEQAGLLTLKELLANANGLGEWAVRGGCGIGEILDAHHKMADSFMRGIGEPEDTAKLSQVVLQEVLSPFDAVYRGAEEANKALHSVNELLDREARRIAQSLHDEAGQLLATLSLAVDCLGCDRQSYCGDSVQRVQKLVGEADLMFRRLSHEMRPRVLDEMGLVPALHFLADGFSQRRGLTVDLIDEIGDRLCPLLESTIYRMVQVALSNVVQHAGAQRVTTRLSKTDSWVRCSVADDGRGMDPAAVTSTQSMGLGLLGIRERADALGGRVEITAALPHGTEVAIYLPSIGTTQQ